MVELERFNQMPGSTDLEETVSNVGSKNIASAKMGPNGEIVSVEHGFMPGDIIEVCDGELKNLRGTVLSVETSNRIIVQPSHHDLKEPIPFNPTELRKYFEQGDRVKVQHFFFCCLCMT